MIRGLSDFLADLTGGAPRFAEGDHRVATAALLLHTAVVDGEAGAAERKKLVAVLRRGFGLSERAAIALLEEAARREREAVDISDFTEVLRRALSDQGRLRVIEMLWELSFADGQADEFEESVIDRAAKLLGVPASAVEELRRRGARATGALRTS